MILVRYRAGQFFVRTSLMSSLNEIELELVKAQEEVQLVGQQIAALVQAKRKNDMKKKQAEEDEKQHKAAVAEKRHVAREARAAKQSPQKVRRKQLTESTGTDTSCRT